MTASAIGLDELARLLAAAWAGIGRKDVTVWIERRWVRPHHVGGSWAFSDVDVARCRLIAEMQVDLAVDDEAMPVVLSLLDQLYAARRQLRTLAGAVGTLPEDVRRHLADEIRRREAE